MLLKLNQIILYSLFAFFCALVLYPLFIRFLKYLRVGKTIREEAITGDKAEVFQAMHAHKAGTPNMGGAMLFVIMIVMIALSYLLQKMDIINNSLVTREETYIILFSFFAMGLLGLLDDYFNVKGKGAIKWLSARTKLVGMVCIAAFISWWFYVRLGVDYLSFGARWSELHLGILYPLFTFFLTIVIVNAINFTDGLDGLAGWLLCIVLWVCAVVTFITQLYIATAVLSIVMAVLLAFLRFNINPARIFLWDGWAFALGGLLSSLIYLLNMRMDIIVPFLFLFLLFWLELWSSALQIFWKKVYKKKLFTIAPLHHLFEHRGWKEWTIVMRAWLIQWVLAAVTLIYFFYQFQTVHGS